MPDPSLPVGPNIVPQAPQLPVAPMANPAEFAATRVNSISNFLGSMQNITSNVLIPGLFTIAALALLWKGMKLVVGHDKALWGKG